MKRVVITHDVNGIYLGSFIGLGLWTKLDPGGQDEACVFLSEEQAREHVSGWNDPHGNPDDYEYVEVDAEDDMFATMEECVNAGLDPWET